MATLDPVKKDNILVHLLSMGRGSLDFAKKLADEDPNDPEPPPEETPEWCKCRVCVPMPSEEENVCCKRVTCITSYTSFANICQDSDILEVCIKARCDIRADEFMQLLYGKFPESRLPTICTLAIWQTWEGK